METRVISTRRYKAGYEVRREEWRMGDEPATLMRVAYNMNGDYIGTPFFARNIVVKRGIQPELSEPGNSVCSIGFCEREQKWYGWSHRAICGFGIGDVIKDDYNK